MKTKDTEYERQRIKELRKILFDCAPLIVAFAGMVYLTI